MEDAVFTNWIFFPLKTKLGSLVANGKVTIKGTVQVNFTVVEGQSGVFGSFPSQKSEKVGDNGKPIYYPYIKLIDQDTYASFQEQVKVEYENFLAAGVQATPSAPAKATKKNTPF